MQPTECSALLNHGNNCCIKLFHNSNDVKGLFSLLYYQIYWTEVFNKYKTIIESVTNKALIIILQQKIHLKTQQKIRYQILISLTAPVLCNCNSTLGKLGKRFSLIFFSFLILVASVCCSLSQLLETWSRFRSTSLLVFPLFCCFCFPLLLSSEKIEPSAQTDVFWLKINWMSIREEFL